MEIATTAIYYTLNNRSTLPRDPLSTHGGSDARPRPARSRLPPQWAKAYTPSIGAVVEVFISSEVPSIPSRTEPRPGLTESELLTISALAAVISGYAG
jgi:hypothetical protein